MARVPAVGDDEHVAGEREALRLAEHRVGKRPVGVARLAAPDHGAYLERASECVPEHDAVVPRVRYRDPTLDVGSHFARVVEERAILFHGGLMERPPPARQRPSVLPIREPRNAQRRVRQLTDCPDDIPRVDDRDCRLRRDRVLAPESAISRPDGNPLPPAGSASPHEPLPVVLPAWTPIATTASRLAFSS
jgi:hypothetical protein